MSFILRLLSGLLGALADCRTHITYSFAVAVLGIVAGLACWGWYQPQPIPSPSLMRGAMTLELQFRLPQGMAVPPDRADIGINLKDGIRLTTAERDKGWHGDGDRQVIRARASLIYKTRDRFVSFVLPGGTSQSWQLDLDDDPAPMPDYSPWQLGRNASFMKVEMSFRLIADR